MLLFARQFLEVAVLQMHLFVVALFEGGSERKREKKEERDTESLREIRGRSKACRSWRGEGAASGVLARDVAGV